MLVIMLRLMIFCCISGTAEIENICAPDEARSLRRCSTIAKGGVSAEESTLKASTAISISLRGKVRIDRAFHCCAAAHRSARCYNVFLAHAMRH